MSDTTILLACLIAIVVAIVVSFKWSVNMGILAMAFAFIIGCLMQGLSASNVFGFWPDNLIFFLIASALFYGFARENGTLQVFGNKILYRFRSKIIILPWVFFVISFVMGLLGAGPGTIVLLAPIGYSVAAQVGMDPLLMVFAIDSGYNCGTQNPWTGTGVVMYGLVETNLAGDSGAAFQTYLMSYVLFVLNKIIMLALFYIFFVVIKKKLNKGHALSNVQQIDFMKSEPENYTPVQRKTFILIIVSFLLLVIPNIIDTLGHVDNAAFGMFVQLCKPQAVLVIFALIACIMKLADAKKVINKLPMSTILIIAGVAFLMAIAKEAGLMELVTGLFSDHIPAFVAPAMFCLLAAFLSIFSSGTSVVLPLMFPMVPALAVATGLNPVAFYAAAQIGALATPISPFSTAGAQFVGLAPNELSDSLIRRQFVTAMVMMVLSTLLCLTGFCNILKV